MYSIFLVEDEMLIREGIKTLIDWEEYGFSFIGEAADGELAWSLIQKSKPDVIITDIKMPFMDGLELSRRIKKHLPNTSIIILSGYDEFSYAREAIAIGVSEYLLKPVSKEQLIEALAKVKKEKDKIAAEEMYRDQFNKEAQKYLFASRRAFFDELISGKAPLAELLNYGEKLGIDLSDEKYNIVLFLLEEDVSHEGYSDSLAEVQKSIDNFFFPNENFILFQVSIELTAFLIKGEENEIENYTSFCVEKLKEQCLSLDDNVRWTVVAGEPVSRLSTVHECYRTARKKLFYESSMNINSSFNTVKKEQKEGVVDFNPQDLETAAMDQRIIQRFLANALPGEIDSFVDDYFSGFGSSINSMMFRHYVVLNVMVSVKMFLEQLKEELLQKEHNDKTMLEQAVVSVEGAKNYTKYMIRHAIERRSHGVNNKYGDMIKTVKAYMKENFNSPEIGLNTVSRVANVSPTHFSAVFSQQTGKTFVEYLTELRMGKARELLSCTNLSSGDIAFEIGYNDPHYFSYLFKKVNNCTPRDYRRERCDPS